MITVTEIQGEEAERALLLTGLGVYGANYQDETGYVFLAAHSRERSFCLLVNPDKSRTVFKLLGESKENRKARVASVREQLIGEGGTSFPIVTH